MSRPDSPPLNIDKSPMGNYDRQEFVFTILKQEVMGLPSEKVYRNEWKYYCTDQQLDLLRERLLPLLPIDPHADEDGTYLVKSLYFDDYKDTCAHENDAGDEKRFKYRIRSYGRDNSGIYQLERKEKLYGRCHKQMCPLTPGELDALLSGDAAELFFEASQPLLRKFCLDIMRRRFEPKVIIVYERMAFVEPDTHIRITFDRDITASPQVEEFLTGDYIQYPLTAGWQILEVKFDRLLPGYIRRAVDMDRFAQTAFSKYYLGRKTIEGVSR